MQYIDLIYIHPLRPIRTRDEYEHAQGVCSGLLDRGVATQDEQDYLDILSTLIKQWESENVKGLMLTDLSTSMSPVGRTGTTDS